MSIRIDTTMANAKAAPSVAVNSVVWVMKPGPMALVAIRNTAPRRALRPAARRTGAPVPFVPLIRSSLASGPPGRGLRGMAGVVHPNDMRIVEQFSNRANGSHGTSEGRPRPHPPVSRTTAEIRHNERTGCDRAESGDR
ncbi:hypothetical protein GCM10009605_14730 [Nocardiopsis composta]